MAKHRWIDTQKNQLQIFKSNPLIRRKLPQKSKESGKRKIKGETSPTLYLIL